MQTYLARHAVAEAVSLATAVRSHVAEPYEAVCVVPAMAEPVTLLAGLVPAAKRARVLFVLVVNAPDRAPVHFAPGQLADVHRENAALLAGVRAASRRVIELDAAASFCLDVSVQSHVLDVLLLDRASPGRFVPAEQGVGMARCIGGDVALALITAGVVVSHWIHTTDADITLPDDYIDAARRAPRAAVALSYPFWHSTGDHLAADLYEISLRYYVLGLRWAASPYAHHTIGSTLAVDARAYAAVRGVPKRSGAEDFYLMSKLAKHGIVHRPASAPIAISRRVSARVPFGTGPATARIAADLAQGRPFCLYHPRSFVALACVLRALQRFARAFAPPSADAAGGLAVHLAAEAHGLHPHERAALDQALTVVGLHRAAADARQRTTTPAALDARLTGWFDAFRTLKLIHALRDAGLADQPWDTALARAPFIPVPVPADPAPRAMEDLRRALLALE